MKLMRGFVGVVLATLLVGLVNSEMKLYKLPKGLEGSECLDGTQAGFYYEASTSTLNNGINDTWVIFLQGGGHCVTKQECIERSLTFLGSSLLWLPIKEGASGYSTSEIENPYFYHANHIFIPYCCGDWHIGQQTIPNDDTWNFYFNGHYIIKNILDILMNNTFSINYMNGNNILDSKYVLISGESAGGIGTFLNLDFISDYINNDTYRSKSKSKSKSDNNSIIEVKGAPIAGWFFPGNVSDEQLNINSKMMPPNDYQHYIILNDTISGGFAHNNSIVTLWNTYLHPQCVNYYQTNNYNNLTWHCLSIHNMYPFIKTPLFILENKYDSDQITNEMAMPAHTINNMTQKYVKYYGNCMKNSLLNQIDNNIYNKNENGLFFASCYDHVHGLDIANGGATTVINSKYNSSQLVGNWFWNLNLYPNRVIDDCINQSLPCNPTCKSF